MAYTLARAGVDVTLIERQSDFGREFRGEQMMESGISAIKALGLWDKVLESEILWLTNADIFVDRKFSYTIGLSGGPQGSLFLPQPAFLEMVIEEASAFQNFVFHRATAVTSLIEEGGRIVGVQTKSKSGTLELRADVVIGADGRFSKLRKLAGLEAPVRPDNITIDVVWCRLPAPPTLDRSPTSQMYIGDRTLSFAMPCPNGDIQIGWVIDKGSFSSMAEVSEDNWLDQLKTLVPSAMASHMEANRSRMTHTLLNVIAFTLEKWTRPGLLLIGDAAHPMSPAGGQGITMALRDAIVVANELGPALLEGAPRRQIDDICARIEVARKSEILVIQELQKKLGQVYFQQNFIARLTVRKVIPLVARLAPWLIQRTITGPGSLKHGTEDIHLTLSSSAAKAAA